MPRTDWTIHNLVDDMCNHWHSGERRVVRHYLTLHPSLAANHSAVLELFTNEFELRKVDGDHPALDEYLTAYPEYEDELRKLFQISDFSDSEFATAFLDDTDNWLPDDFEFVSRIAVGGLGIVVLAFQRSLGRLVAIKVPNGLSRDMALNQILVEARAAAQSNHPNAVPIYQAGEHNGRPYLVMEYVSGKTLQEIIMQEGYLAAKIAATYVMGVAEAIHSYHERDDKNQKQAVAHLDLKPSNILIDSYGQSRIIDFGLAGIDGKQVEADCIQGTVAYMSPEQASGQDIKLGPHSDIYSLGVVLYETLTGKRPSEGDNDSETLKRIVAGDITPLRAFNRNVPRSLEQICLTCLKPEIAASYPTALEVAQDLKRFLNDEPIKAVRVSIPIRVAKWAKRNRFLIGSGFVGAVSGLLLALLAGALWWPHNPNQSGAPDANEQPVAESESAGGNSKGPRASPPRASFDRVSGAAFPVLPPIVAVRGHSDEIASVTFDIERQRFITASRDRSCRVWDFAGKETSLLGGHDDGVLVGAFQPDRERFVTVCSDGTVRFWAAGNGKVSQEEIINANTMTVPSVAFSGESEWLAIGKSDNTVRICIGVTGRWQSTLIGHQGQVIGLAWSAEASRVASSSRDKTVMLWDPMTGIRLTTLSGHRDAVLQTAFVPNSPWIVTASADGTARIWSMATGQQVRVLCEYPYPVRLALPAEDGSRILTAGDNGSAQVWDLQDFKSVALDWPATRSGVTSSEEKSSIDVEQMVDDEPGVVTCARFFRQGSFIVTAREDGTAMVWDGWMGEPLVRLVGQTTAIRALAVSPDGTRVVTGGADGMVCLYDTKILDVFLERRERIAGRERK